MPAVMDVKPFARGMRKASELVKVGRRTIRVFRVTTTLSRQFTAWLRGYNSIFNSPDSARAFVAEFRPESSEWTDAKVFNWIKLHFQLKKMEILGLTVYDRRRDGVALPVEVTGAHPEYTRLEDMPDVETPEEDYSEGW